MAHVRSESLLFETRHEYRPAVSMVTLRRCNVLEFSPIRHFVFLYQENLKFFPTALQANVMSFPRATMHDFGCSSMMGTSLIRVGIEPAGENETNDPRKRHPG